MSQEADNQFVYAQDWKEGDLVLFHNRGLLHSVVGAFTPDQLRMFHQVSPTVYICPSIPE